MSDAELIISLLQTVIFSLAIIFAILYSSLILFVGRFHHTNNMFIVNVCLSSVCSNLYFTVFFAMVQFDIQHLLVENVCVFLFYAYMVCPLQVPLAFVTFSIHRFCLVVYHTKRFFKTKAWAIICIAIQWVLGFLLSFAHMIRNKLVNTIY